MRIMIENHRGRPRGWAGRTLPRLLPVQSPNSLDIAFAAGFYEGEGSIQRIGSPQSTAEGSTLVIVGQKNREVLDRLREFFGGSVGESIRKDGIFYYLRITGVLARGFVLTVYKFLSRHRRKQIRECLRIGEYKTCA